MRKLILLLIIFLQLLSSCSKTGIDKVFDKTVDERLREMLSADSAALVGSAYGWKGVLNPGNGVGAYFFYFQFNADGTVSMVSDISTATASVSDTATYRLKAIQVPALIFDTYSYIHILSDPDGSVNGGVNGEGLKSDFEFSINKVTQDSVWLQGNHNNSTLVLTHATQQEQQAYLNGALNTLISTAAAYMTAHPYQYISLPDGSQLPFGLSVVNKQIVMQYVNEQNQVVSLLSTFYFTENSLHLKEPVIYKGYSFQDVYWDSTLKAFYILVNGQRIDVAVSAGALLLPLQPALNTQIKNGVYSFINVNPAAVGQSPAFVSLWADCKTKVAAVGSAGRVADSVNMVFTGGAQMQMKYRYHNTAGTGFTATYTYNMVIDANTGIVDFTFVSQDGNGNTVASGFKPFNDYIANNLFRLDYIVNVSGTPVLGGLFNATNPAFFYFGWLQ